ncbi:YfhO family protein [Enterococcus rotai]|uniref:YfhO family protein n=1 Tax=Enterococcus rotai TaxID=118060 RepID=UPI0035C6C2F3
MKKNIATFIKKNGLSFSLSVVVPMLTMVLVYYSIGIYPGSDRTLLASDAFTQYANFHASFNNMLHGEQNIFYTWYGSLGLNNWSFMAYYLNSIFTFLVYFFDNLAMPDTLYFLTILKFGSIGGAFWIFASQTFNISKWLWTGLSVAYALMSFATAYSAVIMWLDALMYLPLIILGIHLVMDKRKPILLFISYLLLFVSNFYMAFMVGVFSFLYYIVRMLTNWRRYKKSIPTYMITSFLAGGASMVTILPTILDLSNNGESLNSLSQFLTSDTGIWDVVSKSMVAVYDTSKYESAPFIYIGLFPSIFCIFFFISKKFSLKNKLLYGCLGLLLIASVYVEPLNLFWHGFHSPNMFLFRFSFLCSFLIILYAGFGLEKVTKEDFDQLFNIIIGLLLLFIAMILFANKRRYDYITTESSLVTIVFLILYLVALFSYFRVSAVKKWIPLLLMILLFVEAGINTKGMVDGISIDWGYPNRKIYAEHYPEIKELVDYTKEKNQTLYRMESLDAITRDDSFNYGYSGITMFSSIRNRHSSSYLNNLGFRSNNSNLTINYENNTLIMDAVTGIRYNLAKNDPKKFGFKPIKKSGDYSLYENSYALPLGVLTDKGIYAEDAVENQTSLINYLAEKETELFSFTDAKQIKSENVIIETDGEKVAYSEQNPGKKMNVTFSVEVPAGKQAYLSMYPVQYAGMRDARATVTINGISHGSNIWETGQYYNLGYYPEAKTLNVTVAFSGEPTVRIFTPDVVLLDTQRFEQTIKEVQEKGVDFQTSGRKAWTSVELEKEGVILTTIPYDKGWKAYIDGEKVEIPTFKEAFLAVPVPSGKHKVELTFLPQGFKAGISLFIGCNLLFGLFLVTERRKRKG